MGNPSRHTPLRIAFRRPWPGTRRGQRLAFIAVIIGFKFAGYTFGEASGSIDQALEVITEGWGMPLSVAGAIGLTVCGFAWFTSYCHHGRDAYGYIAMALLTGMWGGIFALSPLLQGGGWSAAQGSLSYALIAAFILHCAGDVEPNLDGEPLGCSPIMPDVTRRLRNLRGRK